jgi:hypothetical protein
MSGIGNILDLQANGYAEKVTIYGVDGQPVDWSQVGSGQPVTTPRSQYRSHFVSPEFVVGNTLTMGFELCPHPSQVKAIKITNSFFVDLFAQIMPAPDLDTMLTWTGHAERFLIGSMQTIALEGEDLFAELPEIPGQKLYIRFSTELYDYVPLTGVFPGSQRVSCNSVCLFG